MKYWIRINGSDRGPYSAEEIVQNFGASLPGNVPCANVGENAWRTLADLLPDIGTAAPLPAPPSPIPSPNVDAIANGFIKKLIAVPILAATAAAGAPFILHYNRTESSVSGIAFFIVVVIGVSASVIVPVHILSKHGEKTADATPHSIRSRAKKSRRNPFVQEEKRRD